MHRRHRRLHQRQNHDHPQIFSLDPNLLSRVHPARSIYPSTEIAIGRILIAAYLYFDLGNVEHPRDWCAYRIRRRNSDGFISEFAWPDGPLDLSSDLGWLCGGIFGLR